MPHRLSASVYRRQFIPPAEDLSEVDAFVCPYYESTMISVPEAEYLHNPSSLPEDASFLDVEDVSNVTESRCRDYHWLAHWDSSFQCRPAAPAERCCSQPLGGWFAFNGELVKVGLSLPPPPPLLMKIWEWYDPCLMQWTPSSIRLVLAFLAKCALLDILPSVDLFRLLFVPSKERGKKGLFSFRLRSSPRVIIGVGSSNAPNWHRRFFFVRKVREVLEIPSIWQGLRKCAHSEPLAEPHKADGD